jgi:hypothetical protein
VDAVVRESLAGERPRFEHRWAILGAQSNQVNDGCGCGLLALQLIRKNQRTGTAR